MNKCEQCGASLDPMALACPYCHLTTPAGAAAHQRDEQAAQSRAQWAAASQFQVQQIARTQIASTAAQSIWWSVAGLVFCCFPVAIVGVVQGFRARSMAIAQKLEIPARATIGLVLGIVSCVTSIGFITWAEISSRTLTSSKCSSVSSVEPSGT